MADQTGNSAAKMHDATGELTQRAAQLATQVNLFVSKVRAS